MFVDKRYEKKHDRIAGDKKKIFYVDVTRERLEKDKFLSIY